MLVSSVAVAIMLMSSVAVPKPMMVMSPACMSPPPMMPSSSSSPNPPMTPPISSGPPPDHKPNIAPPLYPPEISLHPQLPDILLNIPFDKVFLIQVNNLSNTMLLRSKWVILRFSIMPQCFALLPNPMPSPPQIPLPPHSPPPPQPPSPMVLLP